MIIGIIMIIVITMIIVIIEVVVIIVIMITIAIIVSNMTNFDINGSSRCPTGCMQLTWSSAQWRQLSMQIIDHDNYHFDLDLHRI